MPFQHAEDSCRNVPIDKRQLGEAVIPVILPQVVVGYCHIIVQADVVRLTHRIDSIRQSLHVFVEVEVAIKVVDLLFRQVFQMLEQVVVNTLLVWR